MTDTLSGQVIGKYKLMEKLGRGGMAEVYKAYQENLDRFVAIKLMHAFLADEEDFLERFKREARAMAALNHPNIVGIFDFDIWKNDTYYLVMEYISGGTLKEHLEELANHKKRMPVKEAVRLALEVAEALAYAHKRNMVHRDIKPANIMLNESGRAVLTDFGIVKLLGGQTMAYTATGALIGTPSYMSPEQAMGKPGDERCDIYSLGVLLFLMTTGALPFEADTPLAVVMKHVNDPVPMPVTFNPDVPPGLQAIILKALEKDPDERYQRAADMASALRHVDLSVPAPAPAFPPAEPTEIIEPAEAIDPNATIVETEDEDTASDVVPVTAPVATPEPTVAAAPDVVGEPTGPTAVSSASSRPGWLIPLLAVMLIAIIGGGIVFATNGFGGDNEPAVAVVPTATEETPTATPSTTPTGTAVPDVAATVLAGIALTEEANATGTPAPTATPSRTPSPTPTVNATAEFLASCEFVAELTLTYPYNNPSRPNLAIPVGSTFTYNWQLTNSGACPWPDDLTWSYVAGTQFGYDDGPISLATAVAAGEDITLSTQFIAPPSVNTYESVWQLTDGSGEPIGPPFTFEIRTYVPATNTPVPTAAPTATATSEVEVTELNYITEFIAGTCEYQAIDWQCQFRLTPYGGGGGPYSVFIFDQPAGQATELRGQNAYFYFPKARRCAAFNANVRILDEATGMTFDRPWFVNPNDYFNCAE